MVLQFQCFVCVFCKAKLAVKNNSVKIDNNGRISFLESNIVANITVFVKQNNSTKIYTTFQVEVLNGSGDYLEKNVVYIYDNETKEDIKATLERLNSKRKEKLQPIMVPQDKSEEDIDINHEGSLVGVMTADALQTIKEKQIESEEDSKRNDIDENR